VTLAHSIADKVIWYLQEVQSMAGASNNNKQQDARQKGATTTQYHIYMFCFVQL
jgi:hypothetical protein